MSKIEVVQADITTLDVGAIQNAANGMLVHGAGVAGAIVRAGGDVIQQESRATLLNTGVLEEGQCVWTTAGSLPSRYVIHAVTMRFPGQPSTADIANRCTWNTLSIARALSVESVALIALGTGFGRVPIENCAAAMVDAVRQWEHEDMDIVFCVADVAAKTAFEDALGMVVG